MPVLIPTAHASWQIPVAIREGLTRKVGRKENRDRGDEAARTGWKGGSSIDKEAALNQRQTQALIIVQTQWQCVVEMGH